MWPIGGSSCDQTLNSKKLFICVLMKKKKEKKKDNHYKLKKAMAITIGLTTLRGLGGPRKTFNLCHDKTKND